MQTDDYLCRPGFVCKAHLFGGITPRPRRIRARPAYAEARSDSPSAACPAASRAVSTRNGEHDT